MDILFGKTDKRRNSTKDVSLFKTYICRLKEATDICNPIILIHDEENLTIYNYAYIPEFARYYYVVSWTSVRDKLWEAQLQVDVMLSYKQQIFAADAFVMYSESKYNTMLPDHRLPRTTGSNTYLMAESKWSAYDGIEGCYIISIGSDNPHGGNGMAAIYAVGSVGIINLAKALMSKALLDEFKEYTMNPFDLAISCRWIPCSLSSVIDGTSTIKLADYDTGVSAGYAKEYLSGNINFDIQCPYRSQQPDGSYTYADYRNTEPYTQYLLSLPGYGMWEMPMIAWLGYGSAEPKLYVTWTLEPISGNITYAIGIGNQKVSFVHGNVGCDMPMINSVSGIGASIAPYIRAIGGTAMTIVGGALGAPTLMLGGATTALTNVVEGGAQSLQQSFQVTGNMGGKDGLYYNNSFRLLIRPYDVSDSPGNVGGVIGRPCFKKYKVNQLSGFAKLLGCYPEVECTQQEYDMLIQLLNSGANYQYGGVFIE